jgi:hypothetical protein
MSKRENRAVAAGCRELAGVDFDEFTRRAPITLLLTLGRYATPTKAGVPHGALQPGALLLEQRMGFIRELQYRGIGRCRVPANSQQQFDRCPARGLVEIAAGQFAKFRCGGSVRSLAHSLEPLTAGHDLPAPWLVPAP